MFGFVSISASPPPPPPPQFNEDEEEPLPPMEEDPYAATGPDIFSTNWIPQEYLEKGIVMLLNLRKIVTTLLH